MIENYLKHLENKPLYVVGGAIRDRILKRYSSDIDIVLPYGTHEVAVDFADKTGGAYILLDDEPHQKTERVVIKSYDETFVFDFTKMRGASIKEDLEKRDFTINAMALPLVDYLEDRLDLLIDPFDGRDGIRGKKIEMLTEGSFKDDPLRMLRALRFAGQLGFSVDMKTRKSIIRNRCELKKVSWERIRDEFFKILSLSPCTPYIVDMDGLGLLEEILPEILSMKGVCQNGYHHLYVWEHILLSLKNIDIVMNNPEDYFAGYSLNLKEYLKTELVLGRSRDSIIKLATLLHDSGKPETASKNVDGCVKFIGHEDAGSKIAEKVARRLKLSNKEISFVKDLVGNHMHLINFSFLDSLSQKGVLRFFRKNPEEFWAYFILFLADSMAALGPDVPGDRVSENKKMTKEMLDKYYHEFKPRSEKPRLVTGQDLIDKFDLSPGPFLGRILTKVEEFRIEGRIKDREEALRYVEEIIGNN
ncbi:MAG: HD domain-containing protein [Syntrophales bacterium]|nr:HD domain-containing protein [Syntrophales bacterium]